MTERETSDDIVTDDDGSNEFGRDTTGERSGGDAGSSEAVGYDADIGG